MCTTRALKYMNAFARMSRRAINFPVLLCTIFLSLNEWLLFSSYYLFHVVPCKFFIDLFLLMCIMHWILSNKPFGFDFPRVLFLYGC